MTNEKENLNRRDFLSNVSLGALGVGTMRLLGGTGSSLLASCSKPSSDGKTSDNKLPRWRGFNYIDFSYSRSVMSDYKRLFTAEQEFKWFADWGFNFVRIPLSYWGYVEYDTTSGKNITSDETVIFREEALEAIEQTVHAAHKYNLHVNLCLHRAPGFCITDGAEREPFSLWWDEAAQQAFYTHWDMWAKRFKNVSPELLSFNLVNEPNLDDTPNRGEIYRKICEGCLDVIHQQTPDRLVLADGRRCSRAVTPELMGLNIEQSFHMYEPHNLTHWDGTGLVPKWPGGTAYWSGGQFNVPFSREKMQEHLQPWIDLAKHGVGVHCGETGGFPPTPYEVYMAWLTDLLDILKGNNIGWALWYYRGGFGLLNGKENGVQYENFYGRQLDRRLLTLLQNH